MKDRGTVLDYPGGLRPAGGCGNIHKGIHTDGRQLSADFRYRVSDMVFFDRVATDTGNRRDDLGYRVNSNKLMLNDKNKKQTINKK